MLLFLIICGVLAIAVIISLVYSIRKRRDDARDLIAATALAANQENIAITRERLALLPDGPEFEDARRELESALAEDLEQETVDQSHGQHSAGGRRSALVIILLMPAMAGLMYGALGDRTWIRQAGLPTAAEIREDPQASLEILLNQLEQRLAEDPDNPAGLALAGQTYMSIGRYEQAEEAYSKANRLQPDDPDLLAAWADATLLVNNNDYNGSVSERIDRALALNPRHVNALWIGGMGNLSRNNTEQALEYLTRLRPLLDEQPEVQQQVALIIGQIQGAGSAAPTEVGPRSIAVTVSIDEALSSSIPEDQPVFVFARAVDGPPFPLAAARLTVSDLPATVVLDENSAMIEGRTITSVERVVVAARIAMSGQPTAQPGDLTSKSVEVATAADQEISLEINETVE